MVFFDTISRCTIYLGTPDHIDENTQEETMPLGQHNGPLPPDDDDNEDILAYQPQNRDGSPLPPDPPGREDIMRPEPWHFRIPGKYGGHGRRR